MAPEFLKGRVRRGLVVCAVLACGVSAPARATASFANRELGIGVAGFTIMPSAAEDVKWGLPITLEGGYYIDSGFMAYLRVPLMILQNDDGLTRSLILGTGGQLGLRYLFLQESVRPYVMLHLAGLYFFRDATLQTHSNFYLGLGTGAGIDFFVAESVALGIRATVDFYFDLKPSLMAALGGAFTATTSF